jgi:hypothetical protein
MKSRLLTAVLIASLGAAPAFAGNIEPVFDHAVYSAFVVASAFTCGGCGNTAAGLPGGIITCIGEDCTIGGGGGEPVPERASMLLLGSAMLGLGAAVRRKI